MLRVGIAGASGRMGKHLIEAVTTGNQTQIGGALVRSGSSALGVDAGLFAGIEESHVLMTDDLNAVIDQIDVLIDFTTPETSLINLFVCAKHKIPVVLGTTGFSDTELDQVRHAAEKIPVCLAANFSTGVNLCLQLLHTAAKVLGDDVDIEILEAHHRHKVDAPSGTALAMGHEIAETLGLDPKKAFRIVREGITGAREPRTIGFASIRAGDIVGEHTVIFATEGERIEITHKASSRMAFAKGAVRAAIWLAGKQPDMHDMRDVLGLDR